VAAIPLGVAVIVYITCAKDAPDPQPAKGLLEYLDAQSSRRWPIVSAPGTETYFIFDGRLS
jgi:hypothetical protein